MKKICESKMCGKKFSPVRKHQRFCSDKCRWDAWIQRKAESLAGRTDGRE